MAATAASPKGNAVLEIAMICLSEYCEWKRILLEAQGNFRPRRSTVDMVYVVRRVKKNVSERERERERERDLLSYMRFIDP